MIEPSPLAIILLLAAAWLCLKLIARGARAFWRRTWFGCERPPLGRKLWLEVMERDGWTCRACGETDRTRLQIDHFDPWSMGGAHRDPSNLQVLCRPCNLAKSNRSPGVWERLLFKVYLWTR